MNISNLVEIPPEHIYFTRKKQGARLYKWFETQFPVGYGFQEDYDVVKGEGSPVNLPGLKKYDTFNFQTLLSNSVVMYGRNTQDKKEIVFEVLNINRMSMRKFKELANCVAYMLHRYTDCPFDRIAFRVFFFNRDELNGFHEKRMKIKLSEYLMEKNIYCSIANACTVDLVSLDLDKKYHLHRDIDI